MQEVLEGQLKADRLGGAPSHHTNTVGYNGQTRQIMAPIDLTELNLHVDRMHASRVERSEARLAWHKEHGELPKIHGGR
jgi:hypothetical protein